MRVMLDEGAYKPVRAHETDAGLDLRTPVDVTVPGASVNLMTGAVDLGCAVIDTGIHIEFPQGWYGKIEGKSGLNVNHGVVSLGGVIDESYVGSIVVKLYNATGEPYTFKAGEKVAQLIIHPYLAPWIEYVDELDETERGSRGFGSTGK